MEVTKKVFKNKNIIDGVYSNSLLSRKIHLPFNNVGANLRQVLETQIKKEIEGKCSVEGYIKPDSTKIVSYSSGLLQSNVVSFEVVFECLVCCPVEGQNIKCVIKNITQAGIRAVINSDTSPIVVYLSRDHHYNNEYFTKLSENEEITIRVIGQRYELNDPQVSVIGEFVKPKLEKYIKKVDTKPKLVIK
jgi:DNA-directed RNA polymerase subunit E'/Rpb7